MAATLLQVVGIASWVSGSRGLSARWPTHSPSSVLWLFYVSWRSCPVRSLDEGPAFACTTQAAPASALVLCEQGLGSRAGRGPAWSEEVLGPKQGLPIPGVLAALSS